MVYLQRHHLLRLWSADSLPSQQAINRYSSQLGHSACAAEGRRAPEPCRAKGLQLLVHLAPTCNVCTAAQAVSGHDPLQPRSGRTCLPQLALPAPPRRKPQTSTRVVPAGGGGCAQRGYINATACQGTPKVQGCQSSQQAMHVWSRGTAASRSVIHAQTNTPRSGTLRCGPHR